MKNFAWNWPILYLITRIQFAVRRYYGPEGASRPQPYRSGAPPRRRDGYPLYFRHHRPAQRVILAHANLSNFCGYYGRNYELKDSDAIAAYASFGFDACLMDMFPALTHGCCVHLIPEEMRLDLEALNTYFNDNGVTLAFMTTQLGLQFAEMPKIPTLRALSTGGETLVPTEPPQGFRLYNLYGPTECTVFITSFLVDKLYDRVPLGRPIDNTQVYISEDPDYARLYHSGDVARWLPDGNLDFIGRRDFQVKIRGLEWNWRKGRHGQNRT